MQTRFSVSEIPAGARFYTAYDTNLMLFGLVSMGIKRDAFRLEQFPDLAAHVAEAAVARANAPRFVQSVDDAAEFLAGLYEAEVGAERMTALRKAFAAYPDEFAAYSIQLPGDAWIGEKCFDLAFAYATGGRDFEIGKSADDDLFAAAMWETFAEAFFAKVEA